MRSHCNNAHVCFRRWYGRAALQFHGGDDTSTNAVVTGAPSTPNTSSPTSSRARFVKIAHVVMAANKFKALPKVSAAAAAKSPIPMPTHIEHPPGPPSPPPYLTERDFENEDAYKRYVKDNLRIGMRARVARDPSRGVVGDIVTLARDDGSFSPLFRWSNGEEAYLTVSKVELIRDDDNDKSTAIASQEMKSCPACTFVNASHLSKCEMCGTALPKEVTNLSTAKNGDRWLRVSGAGNNDVNGLWAVDRDDAFVNGRHEYKKLKEDGTLGFVEKGSMGVDKLQWSGPKHGWTFVGTIHRISTRKLCA